MSKPRICPACGKTLPLDRGYSFDEDLNMICSNCKCFVICLTDHESTKKELDEKQNEAI